MVNIHMNIQLMLEFLKGPFLVLHFSYYILMTFLMMLFDVIFHLMMIIAIYADDTTLYSSDQASDLWQQLELASELNLIYETPDWGRK